MGINFSKIRLTDICKNDKYGRLDAKFNRIIVKNNWNLFNVSEKDICQLNDILTPYYCTFLFKAGEEYKGIPTGKDYLNEFGEIIDYQVITSEEHPGRLKYKIDNECILISSLKGAKTPALSFDFDLTNYVFSNGFYIFKIKTEQNEKKFILYLLRTKCIKDFLDNNLSRGIGISTFREDDFLRIKVKKIAKEYQQKVLYSISSIESEIESLKSSKIQDTDIINKILGEELGIDWKKFNQLRNIKQYKSTLSDFSKNVDCRMSYSFHNKAHSYILDLLKNQSSKRLKDYLNIPITLGASISPLEFDEDGDCYYISMATVKYYIFNSEDAETVSKKWERENENKKVCKNDIIMTRSGAAIGKFALLDKEINGIFADFTMRIQLKDFNPLLAYYYFRSVFIQTIVHSQKKGLQNKNIFPNQVQEFPMPDWNLEKQAQIVAKIKDQLDAQKKIDDQIRQKQQEILQIVENAIK